MSGELSRACELNISQTFTSLDVSYARMHVRKKSRLPCHLFSPRFVCRCLHCYISRFVRLCYPFSSPCCFSKRVARTYKDIRSKLLLDTIFKVEPTRFCLLTIDNLKNNAAIIISLCCFRDNRTWILADREILYSPLQSRYVKGNLCSRVRNDVRF